MLAKYAEEINFAQLVSLPLCLNNVFNNTVKVILHQAQPNTLVIATSLWKIQYLTFDGLPSTSLTQCSFKASEMYSDQIFHDITVSFCAEYAFDKALFTHSAGLY